MGREIDWGSAEVVGGTLTVPLAGEAPDDWSEYASGVLDRLGSGGSGWGEISFADEHIEVSSVTAGAEADLRHLLESAVLQANAHFERKEAEEEDDDEDEASAEDKRMTEAFRAFGEGGA